MTNALLISDLHFTNKPQDEYRFDLFSQITDLGSKYNCAAFLDLYNLIKKQKYCL